MPKDKSIKKVLVIGSGPIIIGQAAEFDYSGTQACRALRSEGIEVVLLNSNPATIMTDGNIADKVYVEPMNSTILERIIALEKPDSILPNLGGQTGLNLAMELARSGFLEKSGVRLLGAKPDTIDRAEDRQLFKDTMQKLGEPVIPSRVETTLEGCLAFAREIGYPVIVRPAFTMGGTGGGICADEQELHEIATNGLRLSPITQVLIEKGIAGWKEIEYEVMRDAKGNVITVCNMENFDPVGVHTGDSIVVAPSQTLSDKEYQMLRTSALNIITELGIEGGCNVQYALKPDSFEYAVIEVNPRVSRSSALASKATGYPIAKVAAKIAIGYTLDEIPNDVTGQTCACFEPALDYCVVKFPKWPFDKFVYAKKTLGTQMMATGEVMAIANSFEHALMKAVTSVELGLESMTLPILAQDSDAEIEQRLSRCDSDRSFTVYEAIKRGIPFERIYEKTKIDPWFLAKLSHLASIEMRLAAGDTGEALYREAKKNGFMDKTIARLTGHPVAKPLCASYKMVDTCAAEFSAKTPYFYSTYDEENEAAEFIAAHPTNRKKVLVFGSGPIRIGQGIEFDYCSVHCVWMLKAHGCEAVIVNNNPETVSTDFDTADRLYFDPLTDESVEHILATEKPWACVVQFGGQTAIRLTKHLTKLGVKILGSSADSIDEAEDRERFDALLERCDIPRPQGHTIYTAQEALRAGQQLGYPVLLRPSYVLGGQNMIIAYNDDDVREYMQIITAHELENPVLVDKYLMGTECEVDAICDGESFLIPGMMEHIERAGIHSGDSISVYPPQNISPRCKSIIVDYTGRLARALKVVGLMNIQFVIYNNEVYIIEVNPRSSRTVPYISKVTGVPMVDLAVRCMLGEKLADMGYGTGLYREAAHVAVKVPVFSFEKLHDVDTQLGPEMKSTGEVLGIAKTFEDAMLKGLVGAGYSLRRPIPGEGRSVILTVKN
ncbi:MAG: carbamoyl-phosphate synthase large subunit, partial [Ruthenibacterium sp.]